MKLIKLIVMGFIVIPIKRVMEFNKLIDKFRRSNEIK